MTTKLSTLTSAVLAMFVAEQTVQDKRSDAARAFRDAARDESKTQGKAFNFTKWVREQAQIAREALIDASGLGAEFRALDEKGRKEHAATHGKADSLSVLIRQYGSLTVRFSEMKRLYLLDKSGDAYARQFFAGEISLGQALELIASQYSTDKGETEGETTESETEGDAEGSEQSSQEKFRAALAMWAGKASKESWSADFLNIVAEVAGSLAPVSK